MTEKDSRQLELEVYRLEAKEQLGHTGTKLMRSIRKYGKGHRNELKYIYKHLKQREDYIVDLELTLLEKEYQENRMKNMVTMLGECGVPVTVRVMEILIKNRYK